MNERLHELARQAKIEFTLDPTERPIRAFVECWEDELAKFAELIVRECADHIDDLVTCDDDGNQMLDCDDVRTELLEHFGVEQ